MANEDLGWDFAPKNIIILVVTGILGRATTQGIGIDPFGLSNFFLLHPSLTENHSFEEIHVFSTQLSHQEGSDRKEPLQNDSHESCSEVIFETAFLIYFYGGCTLGKLLSGIF